MANNTMGTCPIGGLRPTFLGCCTSNPCNGKGCPATDLRAAGLGLGLGLGEEVSLSLGSYWPNVYCSSGTWWICASHNPSFQGCCDSNPCFGNATRCPQSELHPAAFKSVTTASTFPGSQNTTFRTLTLPMATFSTATFPAATISGAITTDQPPISGYTGSSRTIPWNTIACATQTSSNYTNSKNEPTTASNLYFHTSSTSLPTETGSSNTSYTYLSNTSNNGNGMVAGPTTVTITSISTFTAVRISVYRVPYSLLDSTYSSISSPLPTNTILYTSSSLESTSIPSPLHAAVSTSLPPATGATLPSGTTADSKLVAWGATGGIAFIFIFTFVSWWIRHRKKRINNNEKTITSFSSFAWLPWRKRKKDLPRTSLSTYPFKGMAPSTSVNNEEVVNETWSASLRDYRNLGDMMTAARYDSHSRNVIPPHLSGYESNYSQPFQSQTRHTSECTNPVGVGIDRNSFGQRMVQRGWDGIDLQND
ncbi:hypothetical protein SBOR_0986 [Sclerotinia borealis F-4128]|uniref:Uncharacterized protein n=1 Tax=Sclerotinia borealis (strain F-4128) TaxID=1432307 RepID=W9CRX0_SCLBF|nr:hypothetical protein SBOR_0986 [Sclerotinia borealis F-4128]